jgi:hypothetical protein
MAKIRIWHASRDPYHCAFRFVRLLLGRSTQAIVLERLRVLDMFLLYPTLLHGMSMTQEVRARFRDLNIPRASDIFIRLPGPAVLAQDLRIYQNAAASQLAARGILATEKLRSGVAELDPRAVPEDIRVQAVTKDAVHPGLLQFLTSDLAHIPLSGRDGLYRRAGVTARDSLS